MVKYKWCDWRLAEDNNWHVGPGTSQTTFALPKASLSFENGRSSSPRNFLYLPPCFMDRNGLIRRVYFCDSSVHGETEKNTS